MTVEEIAVLALARTMEFTDSVPSTRSLMYRHIGVKQQQLFSYAARINPDFFGVCAVGSLDDGAVDLKDMIAPVQSAEMITKITVENPGAGVWSSGTEVNLVSLADPSTADPPRAILRNRVLRHVASELDGVLSLTIHYSRLPAGYGPTDGNAVVEIPDPHSEIMVVDLTRLLLSKTVSLDPARRGIAITALVAEHNSYLEGFGQYVAQYAGALAARFGDHLYRPHVPGPYQVGTV